MTLAESQAACRRLTRATAKNFGWTFCVLPRDQARDMSTLYAFMRHTDDLADAASPAPERRRSLEAWRTEFATSLAGEHSSHRGPGHELLPAIAELVHRRAMDASHFHAVINGCLSDTEDVAVDTPGDLDAYCFHVAGAVGLCCIEIWGFKGQRLPGDKDDFDAAYRLAIKTGFAFQLTNILRDVAEDAAQGRCYLPRSTMKEFGIEADAFNRDHRLSTHDSAVLDLLRYETERAKAAYVDSAQLLDYLDRPGRRVLTAMRLLYGRLLVEIERKDYDVFSKRIRVPKTGKMRAIVAGFLAR